MIKKFHEFKINEKFDYNETYFKLMPIQDFAKVLNDGFLSPVGTIKRGENEFKGNWSIPISNIDEWLTPIKYFGSPLQALLMKPAVTEKTLTLLHLKINEKENTINNRDITKMFVKPSFKGYFSSFSSENEYKINETFIGGKIEDFNLINRFKVPFKLSQYMAEPKSVLDFIYRKGEITYTNKKMTPIGKAMLKVLLKKVFTFDLFKNF